MADEPPQGPQNGNQLASVFVNQFYVSTGPAISRLAFGENTDGMARYFVALSMETANLIELANLINKLILENKGLGEQPAEAVVDGTKAP